MKSNLELVLEDVRNGKPILLMEKKRECEADIVIAAEKCNEFNLAFCMLNVRGLQCIATTKEVVDRLKIPAMPTNNLDPLQTPFRVPVDAVQGTTTGMAANERKLTIDVFVNEDSKPEDLYYPGHMQVLKAKDNLLHERKGHTELSVVLMKLAGLKPIAMIQELINTDGSMAREKDTEVFSKMYDLKVVTAEEIYDEFMKRKM